CGGPFNGGNYPGCSSVGSGIEFVYDPNPNSFNDSPNFFDHSHNLSTRHTREENNIAEEQAAKISSQYWKPPIFYDDYDDDDEESSIPLRDIIFELPLSVAIAPDLPITDSLIMKDKQLNIIPETESDKENESSVKDLNLIPSEFEDTSDNDSECDLLFCDDSPPLDVLGGNSVTFSNPLFDFNDDFTSCKDNPLFDEEFEDISSLDPPELTLVIDEHTLLDTLPLPCTDVLGDAIVDIDLVLGEHLDTLSTRDREIDFDPIRDIEELERLLAYDPVLVLVPRVFDEPLGNSDLISRSFDVTYSNPLFNFDDNFTLRIDNKIFDDDFEDLCSLDPLKATPLLDESILLVTPLPDVKQICLKEVEIFDPFFLPDTVR
ncbi:hypothetical protein Tco_1443531, partial [Tanacetum coccineum]